MDKKEAQTNNKKRKRKLLTVKKEKCTEKTDDDLEFLSCSSSDDDEKPIFNKIKKPRKIDMADRVCGLTDLIRTRVSHMLIPDFNVGLKAPKLDELQNLPILQFVTPQPIYVSNQFPAATDICYHRTINYEHHKQLLLGGRTRYLGKYKKGKKDEKLEKEGIYSNLVFNFAERFNSDPDKYFNGSFDYYYTGGNLNILPTHSQHAVLHATGEKLNNLLVSKYERNNKLINLNEINETAGDENEIFELRAFPSKNSENPSFILRNHSELKLLSLEEDCGKEQIVDEIFSFKAKVPFISFTHVPTQEHLLLTSNMRQQIRQYSLDEGGARMLKLYDLGRDESSTNYVTSWNIIRPYNEHNCFYANGKQLLFMDLRTTVKEWLQVKCRNTQNVLPCDRISSLAVSQHEPLLYVGTYHHLHCLDIRKMRSDLSEEASSLCCFTHQMSYPPAFIDTFRHKDREIVAISSAVAGEVRICELKCGENYTSNCLPYQPPTLKEAYDHAKLTGRCLQVGADLLKRLKCCTTGLAFYTHTGKKSLKHNRGKVNDNVESDDDDISDEEDNQVVAHLLTSNSNGDVFAQHVLERKDLDEVVEQRVNNKSDDIMHKFAEEICNKSAPILQYTDVCNVIGLNRIFRCKNLNKRTDYFEDIKNQRRRRLGRWQKSVASLKQYKDALAQDILSVWDIDEEYERDLVMSQLPKEMKKKPKSESLVDTWLNFGTVIPPAVTVVPMDNITNFEETFDIKTILSQDMLGLPQSTQKTSNDIILEDPKVPSDSFLVGDIISMDDTMVKIHESHILSEALLNTANVEFLTPQNDENESTEKTEINSEALQISTIEMNETSMTTTLENTTQNISKNQKIRKKIKKYVKGF